MESWSNGQKIDRTGDSAIFNVFYVIIQHQQLYLIENPVDFAIYGVLQTISGTAEGIRTPDLLVRSQTLYPAELQPHILVSERKRKPMERCEASHTSPVVRLKGFEPPTFWFVAKHSIQLSYSRISVQTEPPQRRLNYTITAADKMQEQIRNFLKFFRQPTGGTAAAG